MEYLVDSWSIVVLLLAAFVIGWGAETAQTFMPRALALTILAWLQTSPEFAVEAAIAWNQQRDLMIANLTGSLRLLLGLGWPLIFFIHFFSQGFTKGVWRKRISLGHEDSLTVFFLFVSVLYFIVIWAKGSLTIWDGGVLIGIYLVYLVLAAKMPVHDVEHDDDLPWVGRHIVKLPKGPRLLATIALFAAGGVALYFSVHPFLDTLQKWSLAWGISTFVFVQWVAPFVSEFPEQLTTYNWARQESKAPLAVMNMVNSNLNQWTLLAGMIPILFNISLGRVEAVTFDGLHSTELALTIAQSMVGAMLLLDMEFSIFDAALIFVLWGVQFAVSTLREEIMIVYIAWAAFLAVRTVFMYVSRQQVPKMLSDLKGLRFSKVGA